MEDYKLERTTVVQPFIKGCFPDGVEVETDCVGTRDDSTRDDVVAIQREPATGSRIPSTFTGAAMNATMKQMVAANKLGSSAHRTTA